MLKMRKHIVYILCLCFFCIQNLDAQPPVNIDSLKQLAKTAPFPERLDHIEKWYNATNERFGDEQISMLKESLDWLESEGLTTDENRFKWANNKLKIGFMYSDNERLDDLFINASEMVAFIDSVGKDNNPWNSLKGHAYFQLQIFASLDKQYPKAIEYNEKAYECFEKTGNKSLMARTLNSMGATYSRMGEYEKSLELEKQAGDLYEEDGNEYGVLRARYYYAAALIDMERYREALNTFSEIIPRMRQTGHVSLNASLTNYADVLSHLGRNQEALVIFNEALQMAKERKVNFTISMTYEYMSDLHERMGNYAAALETERLRGQFNDSLQLHEKEQELNAVQVKFNNYQNEQKIKELEQQQALDKAESRNRFLMLLAGALLLAGMLGFWIYQQKQRNKFEQGLREKEKELTALKERLFTNITHDLRTPLSLIISPLEQLLARKVNDVEKQQLTLALDNSNHLLHLVNQILDWHSLEAKVMELKPYNGEIVQAVNSCVNRFQGQAEQKGITLDTRIHSARFNLFFDFDKMDKILSNLLANALRYTPNGGEVEVRLETNEQELTLKVSDSGIGIPKEKQTAIFDRFEKTSSPEKNNGIGLALVQELVQLMKGSIDVKSVEGKGSVFVVQLPFEKSTEQVISEAAAVPSPDNGKPTLLVVEDHPELAKQIQHVLADTYQVILAFNAKDGLATAIEQVPDLIISDVMLPDRNGMELCQDIKSNMLTDHIPILILTARADERTRLSGLEVRADAFLTKPFKTEELRLQLNSLLQNRRRLRLRYEMQQKDEVEERKDPFVELLMDTVEKNFSESEFNVDAFAKRLKMSRVQLFKKTKALLDTTPSRVIRQYRLQQARQQLQAGGRSVSEVAYGCGFSSPEYFSTVYKDHFGVRPTQEK